MIRAARSATSIDRDSTCCAGSSRSSTPATTWPSPRGTFRVRGDTLEVFPVYQEHAVRVEFFGDEIERLMTLHPLTGEVLTRGARSSTSSPRPTTSPRPSGWSGRSPASRPSWRSGSPSSSAQGKLLEAQRLRMRTTYDIEMMRQVGSCAGIENYSRHIDGRAPRQRPELPARLLPRGLPARHRRVARDRAADRRHVRGRHVPQAHPGRARLPAAERDGQPAAALGGVPRPDRPDGLPVGDARATTSSTRSTATPSSRSSGRPAWSTPRSIVKPTKGQIDDLIHEISTRTERNERVLVTTLTKKMSEDLTDYLLDAGIRTRYLHSEVDTLRRIELLRELRMGEYDVLVGINLLREGLDLPEVSLVAILDADKEGFLRSDKSLIQTIGRAARNVSGQVHMYADKITPSMEKAIDETNRRRAKQVAYNTAARRRPAAAAQEDRRHHRDARPRGREHPGAAGHLAGHRRARRPVAGKAPVPGLSKMGAAELRRRRPTPAGMPERRPRRADPAAHRPDADAAAELQFEVAARLRDEISDLKKELRQMMEAGVR